MGRGWACRCEGAPLASSNISGLLGSRTINAANAKHHHSSQVKLHHTKCLLPLLVHIRLGSMLSSHRDSNRSVEHPLSETSLLLRRVAGGDQSEAHTDSENSRLELTCIISTHGSLTRASHVGKDGRNGVGGQNPLQGKAGRQGSSGGSSEYPE